jgi:hypothetical protein
MFASPQLPRRQGSGALLTSTVPAATNVALKSSAAGGAGSREKGVAASAAGRGILEAAAAGSGAAGAGGTALAAKPGVAKLSLEQVLQGLR